MKRIKWFQRFMIVLLVGINVLVYCSKTGFESLSTLGYTCSAMFIASLTIWVLIQSKKRRIAKISMVKKTKL